MRFYRILLLIIVAMVTLSTTSVAQKGFLRGQVIDGELGDPLIGATIAKKGTSIGVVADFDGNYSLALEPGTHEIEFKFFSFKTIVVPDVVIKAGEVTKLDMTMKPDVEELEEVVITAQVIKSSENAILMVQKKSANVMDGMSSQAFRKIGDSNLSSAMKRVTGVSVQGGKYVYVRGLGDRYTRTTLNGMGIPGLDPERNDVQIDMFPTNVLENIAVYKTFSPELDGDFAGGTVNIETKGFPDEKNTSISLGLGFNPKMNLNKDFVSYNGGKFDWLAYDDGNRDIPFAYDLKIPDVTQDREEVSRLTGLLNPSLASKKRTSFLNTSLGVNHGNQIALNDKYSFGYGIVFNYQNRYKYYSDSEFNFVTKEDDGGFELQGRRAGKIGSNNVLWSGLLTTALKFGTNEIGLTLFKTQNGIKEASDRIENDKEATGYTINQDILTYTQRSLLTPSLYGKHKINNFIIKWNNTFTKSSMYDPDFRETYIARGESKNDPFSISTGRGGQATRFWRNLDEVNDNFKLDLTYEINEKSKIKAGFASLLKWREFGTYGYKLSSDEENPNMIDDPNWILLKDNIYNPSTEKGFYLKGDFQKANNYKARSSIFAGYLMGDFFILPKLRTILGARVEKSKMNYTGENINGDIYDDKVTLDTLNVLPSLNLVYSITDNTNIRFSYGRTLARPSFKEKSIAKILDPVRAVTEIGNINLNQTDIDNYDFRVENFFGRGEMISGSIFYKQFDGHIEVTRYNTDYSSLTWRNIGNSQVYGIEFEFRKNLNFLNGLYFGTNISLAESRVDITDVYIDVNNSLSEYDSRLKYAVDKGKIKKYRPMAGQSPYLINGFISYSEPTNNLYSFNLSYNVQGKSLAIVGVEKFADTFTLPFHSLNLNSSIKLGSKKMSTLGLRINNILLQKKRQMWETETGKQEIFSVFNEGITFNISYRYTF